ncbi:MAG: CrcB protein [Frankiales bacterium]|nr:CrcB protein [Frankiales bacterium]
MTVLLVALGGAAGAAVRWLVAQRLPGRPGTLAVNVAGSLLLGLLLGTGATTSALLGVGFCGALTTFSTYAVEVVEGGGARYAAWTTALCLAACAGGLLLT